MCSLTLRLSNRHGKWTCSPISELMSRTIWCVSAATREHDSLKISNGKWFWWSRGIGGVSALDYLIKVKDYGFVEALTGGAVEWTPPQTPKKDEPKVLLLPPKNKDCNRVMQYLFGRGIDWDFVNNLI